MDVGETVVILHAIRVGDDRIWLDEGAQLGVVHPGRIVEHPAVPPALLGEGQLSLTLPVRQSKRMRTNQVEAGNNLGVIS